MPSIAKAWLKNDAVLWEATGDFDDDGRIQVSAAVAIKCRWQDDVGDVLLPNGETIAYNHVVMVDRAITEGSILWKGKLPSLPSPAVDLDLTQAIRVIGVPDIKNRVQYREVMLMKFGRTLPTIP